MRALGFLIFVIFYGIYLGKMFTQRQKGIRTGRLAGGCMEDQEFYGEVALGGATGLVVMVQAGSIFMGEAGNLGVLAVAGVILGFLGDFVFFLAVAAMGDSWRVGITRGDERKFVTEGIYGISRNPAFLGFDLMYVGLLLIFFNTFMLVASGFAMRMLHVQILREERFLTEVFGGEYVDYRRRVRRYVGKRRGS